jgi:DNA-binding PadR family transcriptional regulator
MHALERQWRQKQTDMDTALARFSPAALYQLLAQSVQEQAAVCHALEESFLEDNNAAVDHGRGDKTTATATATGEREAADWIRRYREAKVQFYLRQERKERWDEGRVGGWR